MTPRSTAIRVALVLGVALVAAGPALRSPWVSGVVAGDRMGSGTVARRFVAALAAGDLDGAMALIAPDAEVLTPDGTTLAGAGKFTGKIVWDPAGAVPEGGIR